MPGLSPELGWGAIVFRLALALAAGGLIGFDRGQRGKSAGLRTTMLVCLAACVAMVLANLLLPTAGKTPTSFITMDLMRLPQGVLSGVGFLGAGAIIRRSDRVHGITTAATLWIVTIIGLCFGGGKLGLGALATGAAMAVLWMFKAMEDRMPQVRRGMLILVSNSPGAAAEITALLQEHAIEIVNQAVRFSERGQHIETHYKLRWQARRHEIQPPEFIKRIAAAPSVLSLEWSPRGIDVL